MSVEKLTINCTCEYCLFARYGSDIFTTSMEESHTQIDRSTRHTEGKADDYGTLVFYRRGNEIVEINVGGQSQSFGYKGNHARAETRGELRTIFGPSTVIR